MLLDALAANDRARAVWDRQLERGAITDAEWSTHRERLADERAHIDEAIATLDDTARRAALIPPRETLAALVAHADDATLRRLCLALVTRITVTRGSVELRMI